MRVVQEQTAVAARTAARTAANPVIFRRVSDVFRTGHSSRLVDLLLAMLIVGRIPVPGLPVGSFDQLGLFLLVVWGAFQRPTRQVPVWYPAAATGLLAFLVFESALNGIAPDAFIQRALNISLSLVTVGFMASGRIDVASVIKGIGLALVGNAALFYAGVAPRYYGDLLSGYLADKNVAGLFYAVMPFLLVAALPRAWQRAVVLVAAAPALWFTGSRTSMAAFLCALIWLAVASRTNWLGKIGVGAALYAAFNFASENLAEVGEFAQRSGSDFLRSNIDEATAIKVAQTPWYGMGLSEATVEAQGSTWFFHNSYAALWVEGGVVMTAVVLALYIGTMMVLSYSPHRGLVHRAAISFPRQAVVASIGAVLLCATRLGEVFMAQGPFIVVGVGLALLLQEQRYMGNPWAGEPLRVTRRGIV